MATIVRLTHDIIPKLSAAIEALKRMLAGGGAVSGTSGGGSAHTHAFTGIAFNPALTQIIAGTGFATVGQVITTTESFTAALNDYAGAVFLSATGTPCVVVSHPAATAGPLVLTVYGAAPPTDAGTWKLYRAPTPVGSNASESSHTHGAGSLATPLASVVHYDRGEYQVTAANATDLETSRTLLRALLGSYHRHINDVLAHDTADAVNVYGSPLADMLRDASGATAAELRTTANALKALYNAHRGQAGVHRLDDAVHAITSPDATDQTSLNALVNELKSDLNLHLADGLSAPSWRTVPA